MNVRKAPSGRIRRGSVTGVMVFLATMALASSPTPAAPPPPSAEAHRADRCLQPPDAPRFTGVSLVAPARPADAGIMAPLNRVNAAWVGVLPYAFLTTEGEVHFDREGQWWGERTDGVAATVEFAREHGLRVMLKPHLWWRGGGWVGHYLPSTPEEWVRWQDAYAHYILTFAVLAEELGAELFVVGTELDATVGPGEDYWRTLIRQVREIYGGEVTYSANWDGFHLVPFWNELDYIGVNAYFPLSQRGLPSLGELERAWQPRLREMEALCDQHGIPIFFPEYGYRSIDGAAGNQWELPPERNRDVPPNLEAQVTAYEALFRSVWNEAWFAGGFLWKWFPDDAARRGELRADYTPQHKPVERVIREWYGGPRPLAGGDADGV